MRNVIKQETEKGITLLIVVLVGSIMLMTSMAIGTYALRMVCSLQARGGGIQAMYAAEQTFGCVKYWVNKDMESFSDAGGDIACNGTTFNFIIGTGGAVYTMSGGVNGLATFTVPDPQGGGVKVEIDYTVAPNEHSFDGVVRIFSQTENNAKILERYQEYEYSHRRGADIMFVIDRSGSIEGNRSDRTTASEWNSLLDALVGSVRVLNRRVPQPNIGMVSFGQDVDGANPSKPEHAVGERVSDVVVPDVPLTNFYGDLMSDSGTPTVYTDDVPNTRLGISTTNISLGVSIAGAALMDRAYPFAGLTSTSPTDGDDTGAFERIVADDITGSSGFSDLPAIPSGYGDGMDRPDTLYPDVIVLISDGAPNAIVSHVSSPTIDGIARTFYYSGVYSINNEFIAPTLKNYQVGETKLFRSSLSSPGGSGKGDMIIDRGTIEAKNVDIGGTPDNKYQWCNDSGTHLNSTLSGTLNNLTYPHYAMCNTTLIVNKLKNEGNIEFIVVYVGTTGSEEADWLKDYIASLDSEGDPLFREVDNFIDVEEAILALFDQMNLTQNL